MDGDVIEGRSGERRKGGGEEGLGGGDGSFLVSTVGLVFIDGVVCNVCMNVLSSETASVERDRVGVRASA